MKFNTDSDSLETLQVYNYITEVKHNMTVKFEFQILQNKDETVIEDSKLQVDFPTKIPVSYQDDFNALSKTYL